MQGQVDLFIFAYLDYINLMKDSRSGRSPQRPIVLCILDGWGASSEIPNNAIALGATPNWDRLVSEFPVSYLKTCGLNVGLPEGQMGNSEVGHMNLGAGRVVMQDLPRIDAALVDGGLGSNRNLAIHIAKLRKSRGTCHLLGLLSSGGVHSHQNHIVALARAIASQHIPVFIHAFLDGRDTPPKGGREFMANFLEEISDSDNVRVATVSGRYYAMDRDKRWDRVQRAYEALVSAKGAHREDALSAIESSYDAGFADEFILPTVIGDYEGMHDGDGLLMANFRADRVREILTALVDPNFDDFPRSQRISFAARTGMVEYSRDLKRFFEVLFEPLSLSATLGEIVANAGLRQLRIAETEKYAHVTFFFNGGRELEFAGEDRILISSPKVPTYDLKPEMSAPEVTDNLVEAIDSGTYDLIIANFANCDMVGHTGVFEAAKLAVETVDESLGRLEVAIVRAGGVLLVTADHGNCEQMLDDYTGQPFTQHTLNDVPAVLVNASDGRGSLLDGRLSDIAPTILDLLGLDQPEEMTGKSLLEPNERFFDKHPAAAQ